MIAKEKVMKYCSIDLETCGLVTDRHSILEFGAVLDDLDNPLPIEELPRYHCYFLSVNDGDYVGDPYALSMHPTILRRIAEREEGYNYYSPMKFGFSFKQFLLKHGYEAKHDRITINAAGKNFGAFDLQVLNKQTDLSKHVKIRHRLLDPGAMFVTLEDESVPGMEDCLERIGEEPNVAHTAIEDSIDVIKLIRFKMLGVK